MGPLKFLEEIEAKEDCGKKREAEKGGRGWRDRMMSRSEESGRREEKVFGGRRVIRKGVVRLKGCK